MNDLFGLIKIAEYLFISLTLKKKVNYHLTDNDF